MNPSTIVMHIFSSTCSTVALAVPTELSVKEVVRMTLRAVGSPSFSLPQMSSEDILMMCYWFQMCRVNALRIAAQMIEVFAGWDWPHSQLVSEPMSSNVLRGSSPKTSISKTNGASPQPAGCPVPEGAVLVNLGPEAGDGGIIKEHRKVPPFGVMRWAVSAVPPPFIVSQERE